MLNKINTIILSELTPSEYRMYYKAWKGKHPKFLELTPKKLNEY